MAGRNLRARRSNQLKKWHALIKKDLEVDPLPCPYGDTEVGIAPRIDEPRIIERIASSTTSDFGNRASECALPEPPTLQ